MKSEILTFIEKEQITLTRLCNPVFVYHLLYKHKYLHFFLIGISGVAFALLITWALTEYIFGLANYFTSYLVGLTVNLIHNFVLHTTISFGTKKHHSRRFIVFVFFSLLIVALQAITVKFLTPIVGLDYYLIVIAAVIFFYSTISFFLFKFVVFSEK